MAVWHIRPLTGGVRRGECRIHEEKLQSSIVGPAPDALNSWLPLAITGNEYLSTKTIGRAARTSQEICLPRQ